MSELLDQLDKIDQLKAKQKRLMDEAKQVGERAKDAPNDAGLKERHRNLMRGVIDIAEEIDAAEASASKVAPQAIASGEVGLESGDGPSQPKTSSPTVGSAARLGAPAVDFGERDLADLFDAAQERKSFQIKASTKAVTVANAGPAAIAEHIAKPFVFKRETTRILDLIPVARTDRPSINYFRTTTAASAAAAVAEGADKPESSPVVTSFDAPVKKIAHFTRVNDEVIADFPDFRSFIGTEMVAGLILAENNQLLNGSGSGANLTGLLNTSGIITRAKGVGEPVFDTLFLAVTDLRTGSTYTEPDVIVMHPDDYAELRLLRTADGVYISGAPMEPGFGTLWGVPVVVTTQIAAGTALVANLKEAATVYVRQGPTLEVAPLGGGTAEFIANQTLIRAEERIALAVQRPTAIVKVTGL